MRILVCSWGNIYEPDLALSLEDMGHEVVVLKEKIKNKDYDIAYLKRLSKELIDGKYDCVFSANYVPIISRVCNVHQLKYISWTVDSPLFQLNSDTIVNPCNYIFIFDRLLYEKYKGKAAHIYYMPLGTNVKYWDSIRISESDLERFQADVSFVGSLYEDKHSYDKVKMPDYLKGYFDGIIKAQSLVYGYNFLDDVITDDAIEEFSRCAYWSGFGEDYEVSKKDIIITEFVGRKCAELERVSFVSELAKKFQFDLYTLSNTTAIPHVNNKGAADSRVEMPKVFQCSKINLNMTIKTIESGIPLRIFDIMGNKGFVITNYQSELLDYFVPDEDLVIYESREDLVKKISYYLQHEEERIKIAENGYQKVKRRHTIENRLKDIITIVWQDQTKCYATNQYSININQMMLDVIKNIKANKILDVGLFLGQCISFELITIEELKQQYCIDGVSMVLSHEEKEAEGLYQNVYSLNQVKETYDMILCINVLKCLQEQDMIQTLHFLKQHSCVILLDYEETYMDMIERYHDLKTQKIQAGKSALLLITVAD